MALEVVFEISDTSRPPAHDWAGTWLEGMLNDARRSGSTAEEVTELGTVLIIELSFPSADEWRGFRDEPRTLRALHQVPDPVEGLQIYRWFGEGSRDREPRSPRPASGTGAVALPISEE
jgi:hypothetical protein